MYENADTINDKELAFKEFEIFTRFKMRFCLFLTAVILGAYFSFLILVGFFPEFLSIRIGDSAITLGIVFGVCSILLGVLGTGIYSFVVNYFLDSKQEELLARMTKQNL
ncbi:DUF485 domain-containing protein [Campylobacter sp. MIT 21-1685]|uniref:DUF485 domain-containing protein n=1 Tax=unclassified Campylobacter TaxID=2593542 RepID=UPI00224B293A|nr:MULTISPECIES: DUF485 domain-containing protein [unclassified Campylobacter]MCX2682640.1 DUF485 domain-containing protein [Campylobacter sp. MIT 21-1684]MCX2750920.1 DUF485 domain-containing protein [Campylobacter sp. MIT 21-1682]MCX2807147.1 DUF485 domain-containing protein [Campylobacter sp. MIT 21-1685]